MKYLRLFLLLFVLISCSFQNQAEKDTDLYDVKGKVLHLTIRHYYAEKDDDGNIVKGEPNYEGEVDQTITFNEDGYITQGYFYGQADTLDSRMERDYEDGLCIAETRYDSKDNIMSEWVWLYDDNNNNVERIQILEDGALFPAWKLFYNEKNQLIARMSYRNPESAFFDSLYWVLDNKGRQIEEYSYGLYGYYGKNLVEYEGNNDQPSKAYMYDGDDQLTNILEMEYNKNNFISKISNYNADTVLVASVSWQFEYDEKGNWVKAIMFYNDEPETYEERTIVYY